MPTNTEENPFYLVRGSENIEADEIAYNQLMKHYNLDSHLRKMQNTTIPTTYHHFLRGVGEPKITLSVKGNLLSLLEGVPFDRPIEPFTENILKQALQVPAANKQGTILHPIVNHRNSTSVVPSSTTEKEEKLKQKTKDEAERKEKKEKKKEKRKREETIALQQVLTPLIMELRNLTWNQWMVNNKPGNPFILKITKENCKRVGVPNYFDFVQEPMDLTRMKEQNEKGGYTKIEQFTEDIQLMVRNAMTFNRTGEPVHQMAVEIQQLYNQKLAAYQTTQEILIQERKKRKKEKKKKRSEKK